MWPQGSSQADGLGGSATEISRNLQHSLKRLDLIMLTTTSVFLVVSSSCGRGVGHVLEWRTVCSMLASATRNTLQLPKRQRRLSQHGVFRLDSKKPRHSAIAGRITLLGPRPRRRWRSTYPLSPTP